MLNVVGSARNAENLSGRESACGVGSGSLSSHLLNSPVHDSTAVRSPINWPEATVETLLLADSSSAGLEASMRCTAGEEAGGFVTRCLTAWSTRILPKRLVSWKKALFASG